MKYRIIIAGGRDFDNYTKLKEVLSEYILDICLESNNADLPIKIEIVSGKARGADSLGEAFAREFDYDVVEFPADWNKYGKSAGPIRNREMAKYAAEADKGVLFAFWDGESKGTKNMIDLAIDYGLEGHIIRY